MRPPTIRETEIGGDLAMTRSRDREGELHRLRALGPAAVTTYESAAERRAGIEKAIERATDAIARRSLAQKPNVASALRKTLSPPRALGSSGVQRRNRSSRARL